MRRALLYEIQNSVKNDELFGIHVTTPLPCKYLDGQGVHSQPVKFSTVPVKILSPIWAFEVLNVKASKFLYV